MRGEAMLTVASQDQAGVLDKFTLFQALEPHERAHLAARAVLRKFRSGETIFVTGDPGDCMMAVLVGTVRISLPTVGDKDIIVRDLPAGEIFGEIALLDGLGRSADATALTNVELLVIHRRDALQFLSEHPDVCLRMLALICRKLRASDELLSDIAHNDLGARLAKAMLRCLGKVGPKQSLIVTKNQGELARMIGNDRASVNRQLAIWRRQGIVEIESDRIFVERSDELERIAGAV
jgi:CRP-like cAMP-binding protein